MKSPCERIQWNCSGSEIEQESFRRIDREAPPALRQRFTDAEWHVARRLIHTTADFAIAEQLRFSPGAIEAALAALRRGARIYTDSNMIKSGLSIPKLQKFHPSYSREAILCPVADPETAEYAKQRGITRALAAVGPVTANLLCAVEPILNPLWVALAFGERPGRFALAGAALVLAGVVGCQLGGAPQDNKREAKPAKAQKGWASPLGEKKF